MIYRIKNIEVGFKYNNYTSACLLDFKGIDLKEAGVAETYAMLFCMYKSWCFVRRTDERISFEDMCDWIDGEPQETLKAIVDEMYSAPHFKKMQEGLKKNEPENQILKTA